MSRLAKLLPQELGDDQRVLYDAIAHGPRATGPQAFRLTDEAGGLEGPFNAMLRSPGLGSALQALGSAARYSSALTDRARELVILVVAHQWRSEFELYAHDAAGTAAGLTAHELDALRTGRLDQLTDDRERLTAVTALALAARNDLDDVEYAAATTGLGEQQLFEITTIVGYYATLALQLRVYRVAAPTD